MRKYRFFWGILMLALAAMACNFPSGAAPTRPPTSVPLSTEEIQQFEEEVAATLANPAPSGEVTVTITERQINTYVKEQFVGSTDDMISDPQVHLTDGKVEIYATVKQGPITSDARIIMVPRVEAGKPKMDVESINIGPLPVPDTFVQQVDQRVDTMLEDYLASSGENFTVNTITVTEGQMVVSGVRQ